MNIFQVIEHVQTSDIDGWMYWININSISYHSSQSNAEAKINKLIDAKLEWFETFKSNNLHLDNEFLDNFKSEIESNIQFLSEGTNYNTTECPFYSLVPITLED